MSWYHINRHISDLTYAFKYRFMRKHQYNRVETGLPPGYYDNDVRMLHACFNILCEHVEEERGVEAMQSFIAELRADETFMKDTSNSQADGMAEMLVLHYWWTVERPATEKRIDDLTMELFGYKVTRFDDAQEASYKELRDLETKLEDDTESMLTRLMKIRQSLWT